MICYRDKTFCGDPECDCGREKLTDAVKAAAVRWGGENAPISVSCFVESAPPPRERESESRP